MPTSLSLTRPQDPSAPRAQLKQFRAHVYFPPEQIFVSQADGIFCGIRISATGQLIKREDYKPARVVSDEEWRQRMELVQRVAAELGRFTFAGGPPSLQVKFTGDLAEMENARVEATLSGERVQRGTYEIKAFSAAGDWSEQKLNLTQLEWTDAAGIFASRAGLECDYQRSRIPGPQFDKREAISRGFRLRQNFGGCRLFVAANRGAFRLREFLAVGSPPARDRSSRRR